MLSNRTEIIIIKLCQYAPLPMNEQRQEAYLNLIQSLWNCPSGEESGFLRVVEGKETCRE